jgi:hypothetical protein
MKVIITKGELLKELEPFADDDRVVIEVHDTVLYEDLYTFYVDPIWMGLDSETNEDRGHEIRLSAIPHEPHDICVLCGSHFTAGEDGNELGFCCSCQAKDDFPYDLDKYYEDYEAGKVAFKGFDTMDRGLLEKYRR